MKKSILILSAALVVLSLTAFGYKIAGTSGQSTVESPQSVPGCVHPDGEKPASKCNPQPRCKPAPKLGCMSQTVSNENVQIPFMFAEDVGKGFTFNVDSRFIHNLTRTQLRKAKTLDDIYPDWATKPIVSYQEVKVAVLGEGKEQFEMGEGATLNQRQLELLQSIDYSTNFYVEANCQRKVPYTDEVYDDYITFYITLIPEQEATYAEGKTALLDYLRNNSRNEVSKVDMNHLMPGKVFFVVNPEGKVTDVRLRDSSGYPSLDAQMVRLVERIPGNWLPATDADGEKISQELVFFFGNEGC